MVSNHGAFLGRNTFDMLNMHAHGITYRLIRA